MSYRHIDSKFVYIDCGACSGEGHITILKEDGPPIKKACEVCKATCLVKVPLEDIPTVHTYRGLSQIGRILRDNFRNNFSNISVLHKQ